MWLRHALRLNATETVPALCRWPLLLVFALHAVSLAAEATTDPLASWNDGPAKQAIVNFVTRISTPGSPEYIPAAERIAVFDNDGTLWAEQPIYAQVAFALDRVRALAPDRPEWKDTQPFKSILEDDLESALSGDERALVDLIIATHTGMTAREFSTIATDWLQDARHPITGRLYTDMAYQPMLDLLAYLRANEFKTYITSGGGTAFLRVFAEEVYGIPPEQVIGSSTRTGYEYRDGKPVLIRLPQTSERTNNEGKPVAINRHIGRRPVAAFGNSDGDLQMLEWTCAGEGERFCLYVHHTDDEREWAYDRESRIGKLDEGLDRARSDGWTVVDMKNDWNVIFSSGEK